MDAANTMLEPLQSGYDSAMTIAPPLPQRRTDSRRVRPFMDIPESDSDEPAAQRQQIDAVGAQGTNYVDEVGRIYYDMGNPANISASSSSDRFGS